MIESSELSPGELRTRLSVAALTFVVGIVILGVKFWAFHITHSQAIYSDALESIVNVVTAVVGFAVIYYSSQSPDEDHPYGHGKVEYFSSAFEGGLIFFAAIFIFAEAVKAQLHNETLTNIDRGAFMIALCGLGNLLFGLFLKSVGKRTASPALQAAGVHLLIDFWTTSAAIVGIILVKYTGIQWLDRAVAVLLGIHMSFSGLKLVKKSATELMDAENPELLGQLAKIFEAHAGDGIIQIHHTKVIRSGWFHHIDGHAVVPEFWKVEQAHDRLDVFEHQVIKAYPYGGEVNFHLDPCKRKYCSVCDFKDCPVRAKPFEARMPVVLEHLRSKVEPV